MFSAKLSPKRVTRIQCSSYDDIFKLSSLINRSPIRTETGEIEKILYNKFKTVHDIDITSINNSIHLYISYRRPNNPVKYWHNIRQVTKMINEWDCMNMFKVLMDTSPYPNFIINPDNQDIIDLPVIINLDIPADTRLLE